MPEYRIKTTEIDGVELEYETEVDLSVQNIHSTAQIFDPSEGSTLASLLSWVKNK